MKSVFITILFAAIAIVAEAKPKEAAPQSVEPIYIEEQVDKTPMYEGKQLATSKMWFLTNLQSMSEYVDGEFTIKFVIEKGGLISNIEIIGGSKSVQKGVQRAFQKTPPKYSPAIKDGCAVRYSISYDISFEQKGNYRAINVQNKESYIHKLSEIDELPRMTDGRSVEELIDVALKPLTHKLKGVRGNLHFNLVFYKDGSVSTTYLRGFPDDESKSIFAREIAKLSPVKPALKDGKAVNYVSKHIIKAESLN